MSSSTCFVVTHGPIPHYPIRDDATIVWLSDQTPPPELKNPILRAYDLFENAAALHDRLSGAMGFLAIYRHLRAMDVRPEKITICAYRKFTSHTAFGVPNYHLRGIPASNYYGMQIIDPTTPNPMTMFPVGVDREMVVSAPRRFPSILDQFANGHKLEHLMLIMSAAIRTGGLTREEVHALLTARTFLPGGVEVGTFPMGFWMQAMKKIHDAVVYYFEHFWQDEPGRTAQFREVSFVTERFGSYLALEYIKARQVNGPPLADPYGHLHTVFQEPLERRPWLNRVWLGLKLPLKRYR